MTPKYIRKKTRLIHGDKNNKKNTPAGAIEVAGARVSCMSTRVCRGGTIYPGGTK
jgi:hypothetical protein